MITKEQILKLSKEDRVALKESKLKAVKFTDGLVTGVKTTPKIKDKAAESDKKAEEGKLDVTVVCSAANFCDSSLDVLSADCYDRSVKERAGMIPHIADHKQSSVAHVGDVTKVYTEEVDFKTLGIDVAGSTTVLLMDSTVREDYNTDVFKFYSNGKINQHSIGLRYKKISLALNSQNENDKKELAVWEKAYPNTINKELVDKAGYFWYVEDIDIIENSCVLFGANSLTPTLSVKSDQPTTTKDISNKNIGNLMTLEEAQAKIISLQDEVTTLKSSVKSASADAVKAEQTRVLGVLDACKTLNLDNSLAVKQIKSANSVETATEIFTAIKEGIDAAKSIDTSDQEQVNNLNTNTDSGEVSKNFMGSLTDYIDKTDFATDNGWGDM